MGTRATVHFKYVDEEKPEAIVYRHGDGHPDGLGKDLYRFLEDVKNQCADTRFNDPSYLAAKYVVWQAGEYSKDKTKPLDFLSVGVVLEDPDDITFRYTLHCSRAVKPLVEMEDMREHKSKVLKFVYPHRDKSKKNRKWNVMYKV